LASIYDLKPRFQQSLRGLVRRLAARGVTANQVTLAALALSIVFGLLLAWRGVEAWVLLLLPLALFARMALNAIDGMLAREHGMKSDLGAILNELGDVISDAALYLPFAIIPGLSAPAVVLAVIIGVFTEFTGVLGIMIGASRRYDGPLGKSDRAFAFGLLAVLLATGLPAMQWLNAYLWLLVALGGLTVFNRARKALAEAANTENAGAEDGR
jgi:CDP-diacylglycerol--glycerol-3-phosphate 3-phosphatidyltransferase